MQAEIANPVNEITGLTNITGPAWTPPAYDPAGNMTTIPWDGTAPAAGLAWSSLSLDDWSNLTVDDWSELTVDASAPALAGALTATYDAWNRLVKLTDDEETIVQENQYDARTFRTVRSASAETRHYYYTPGWRCVEERIGSSTEAERQFIWGLRYIDDLILRDRDTDSDDIVDERLYALQDANWNVVALADSEGEIQERFAYSPYGSLSVLAPDFTSRESSDFDWETTYAGYRWDAASGMYAVRFRYYQPQLGNWTGKDPIGYAGGSTNLYEYTYSGPLDDIDPYGLEGYALGWGAYCEGVGDVFRGYGDAGVGAVSGIAQVALHPIQTAAGVGLALSDPPATAHAMMGQMYQQSLTNRGCGAMVGDLLLGLVPVSRIALPSRLLRRLPCGDGGVLGTRRRRGGGGGGGRERTAREINEDNSVSERVPFGQAEVQLRNDGNAYLGVEVRDASGRLTFPYANYGVRESLAPHRRAEVLRHELQHIADIQRFPNLARYTLYAQPLSPGRGCIRAAAEFRANYAGYRGHLGRTLLGTLNDTPDALLWIDAAYIATATTGGGVAVYYSCNR